MSDKSRSVLSYNKFLRESVQSEDLLTMELQSQQEQVLALETILTFVQRMNSGKENLKCLMKISLQFEDTGRIQ